MIGSISLAVYTSLSIYLKWQDAPVLTTFGSDILPVHGLDFPSVILCSPGKTFSNSCVSLMMRIIICFILGNNMAALPSISHILPNEWKEFWHDAEVHNQTRFESMTPEEQNSYLTHFVRHFIPEWPPELTLQNFMLHMTTHFPALRKTILLWSKESEFRNKSVPVFDLLLNPDRKGEKEKELSRIDRDAVKLFERMDFTSEKQQKIMLSVLWFTAQPCRQLLTLCTWKSQRVPCDKLFYPIPTDIGFCCAFNHDSLKKMLRGAWLPRIIQNLEERFDSLYDGSSNESEDNDNIPDHFTPNWGIQNGLTVVIDTLSNWNPASVRQDFLGVRAAIKGKNQFPIISRDSFLIRPGHETYVAITATHTTAEENLRQLPVSTRKCYYEDEFFLQLFRSYSVKNCWMESLTNFSRAANPSGCVPWNFPSADQGVPMCSPTERHQFLEAFRTAETSPIFVGNMTRCFPNCGGTSYDLSVTAAPFRHCDQANMGLTRFCDIDVHLNPQKWGDSILESYKHHGSGQIPFYINKIIKSKMRQYPADRLFGSWNHADEKYNAFEKDIAAATFYFPRHTALELVKAPKMSALDFLSQVGGILGLCVGISLTSVIEVIYWTSFGLAKRCAKKFHWSKRRKNNPT